MNKKSEKVFKVLIVGEVTEFAGKISSDIHKFLKGKGGVDTNLSKEEGDFFFRIEPEFKLSKVFSLLFEKKESFDFVLFDTKLKGLDEFQAILESKKHPFKPFPFNSEKETLELSKSLKSIEEAISLSKWENAQ